MSDLRFETIDAPEAFDRLGPRWDELVRAALRPSPFLLHGWLAAWWAVYGDEAEMLVELAFRGENLVAALPLEIEHRRGLHAGRLMGRQHAALGDVLLDQGEPDETARQLLQRAAARVDYLDLFGPYRGGVLDRVADHERLRFVERAPAPVLHLRGSWEDTLDARSSAQRRRLYRRRRRQLDAAGGLAVSVARSPDEVTEAVETVFDLHDRRFEGRPDGSELTTERGKAFHRRAYRALGDQGVIRVALIHVGGRPVSFYSFFLLADAMVAHSLGFDPAWRKYSAGIVATHEAIRYAADEGARRVEFLGGDERYKLELADGPEPLFSCIGMATGPRGELAAALARSSLRARLRLKRSKTAQSVYVEGLAPVRRRLGRRNA